MSFFDWLTLFLAIPGSIASTLTVVQIVKERNQNSKGKIENKKDR